MCSQRPSIKDYLERLCQKSENLKSPRTVGQQMTKVDCNGEID